MHAWHGSSSGFGPVITKTCVNRTGLAVQHRDRCEGRLQERACVCLCVSCGCRNGQSKYTYLVDESHVYEVINPLLAKKDLSRYVL